MPIGGGTILLPAAKQAPSSLTGLFSYAWQLYLPRLPGMFDFFGFFPPYTTWAEGFIGRLGWLDYGLPLWIYPTGAIVLLASFVLALVGLARADRIRRHWRELAVFGVCALGLAAQIAYAGYDYHNKTGYVFEQPRYLYPLIALYALGLVTACTALGRRAAPTLAATFIGITCLQLAAVIFATMARYYG